MAFAAPSDSWAVVSCVLLFVVLAVSLLWLAPTRSTIKAMAWVFGLLLVVIGLIPSPWNLVAFVLALGALLVTAVRRNATALSRLSVRTCERPSVPPTVEKLIVGAEQLGFGRPTFVEYSEGPSSSYRAYLLSAAGTSRMMIGFGAPFRHAQRVSVRSEFGVGSLLTSDRGAAVVASDDLFQVVEGGRPEDLLHAHDRALGLLRLGGVDPAIIESAPSLDALRAELEVVSDSGRSTWQSWRGAVRASQNRIRVEHPEPPVRSSHDPRVVAFLRSQPSASDRPDLT